MASTKARAAARPASVAASGRRARGTPRSAGTRRPPRRAPRRRTRRASGSARRPCRTAARSPRTRLSTFGISSELPSDLLIFSPAVVIHALCIQYDANGVARPRATGPARSRGAGSAGRRRRRGCRTPGRGTCRAIAEHSMCQPGRPGPQGAGQAAVSGSVSFLRPFQSAKSRGSRLPRGSASAGGLHVVEALPGQLAVRRPGAHVEVDVARAVLGGVGVAARDQLADQLDHLRDVAGRARLVRRRQHVERGVGAGRARGASRRRGCTRAGPARPP